MLPVSARIGVVALAIAALGAPSRASALGLNFGPLHFYLPLPGFRGGRSVPSEPSPTTESRSPTLLYPVLALPSLYENIFWPKASAPWPFGYQDILDQAFGKYAPDERISSLCPDRIATEEIVTRIARETTPTAAQSTALQKLGTALGQANGFLIKSCPDKIPAHPVERLKRMDHEIDTTIMALGLVRQPLQEFADSLDNKQRAHLDGPAPAVASKVASDCKLSADSVNEPLTRLERAVQPTKAQQAAFATVQDAFKRAAREFDGNCADAIPPTALARLDAITSRLDASWRAVEFIEVALADLQQGLSDEQHTRLDDLEVATSR